MWTAATPVLVTVAESTLLLPTATPPNDSVEGLSVKWPTGALVPLAFRAIAAGEDGSLLVIEMLPLSVPAAVGAYTTLIVADWPGLISLGVVIPLTVKGAPFTVIVETIKSAFPVLDKVTFEVVLLPICALPASTTEGLAVSCGCKGATVPATASCTMDAPPSVP